MNTKLTRGALFGALIVGLSSMASAQGFQKKKVAQPQLGNAKSKELSYIPPIGSAKLYRINGKMLTMKGTVVSPSAADKRVKFMYRAYRPPLLAFKKPGVKVRVRVLAQISRKPFPTGLSRKANLYISSKHGLVARMTVGVSPVRTFRVDFGKSAFKANQRYYVRVIPVWMGKGPGTKAIYYGTPSNAIPVLYSHVLKLNPKHLKLIPKPKPTPPPVEIPKLPGGIK